MICTGWLCLHDGHCLTAVSTCALPVCVPAAAATHDAVYYNMAAKRSRPIGGGSSAKPICLQDLHVYIQNVFTYI